MSAKNDTKLHEYTESEAKVSIFRYGRDVILTFDASTMSIINNE